MARSPLDRSFKRWLKDDDAFEPSFVGSAVSLAQDDLSASAPRYEPSPTAAQPSRSLDTLPALREDALSLDKAMRTAPDVTPSIAAVTPDRPHTKDVVSEKGHAPRLAKSELRSFSNDTADDMVTASVIGEAVAFGENSLADGFVRAKAVDYGAITVVTAKAEFTAAANGEDKASLFTSASSDIEVDGADFIFSKTVERGRTFLTDDGYTIVESSKTKVMAIDIEGWDPAGGPIVFDCHITGRGPRKAPTIEGNVATFDVEVIAEGEMSFADASIFALTLEEQFSNVNIDALVQVA